MSSKATQVRDKKGDGHEFQILDESLEDNQPAPMACQDSQYDTEKTTSSEYQATSGENQSTKKLDDTNYVLIGPYKIPKDSIVTVYSYPMKKTAS